MLAPLLDGAAHLHPPRLHLLKHGHAALHCRGDGARAESRFSGGEGRLGQAPGLDRGQRRRPGREGEGAHRRGERLGGRRGRPRRLRQDR